MYNPYYELLQIIFTLNSASSPPDPGLTFHPVASHLPPHHQLRCSGPPLAAGGAAGHICRRLHKSELSSQTVKLLIASSSFTPAPPTGQAPNLFVSMMQLSFLPENCRLSPSLSLCRIPEPDDLSRGRSSQIISVINCWLNLFF